MCVSPPDAVCLLVWAGPSSHCNRPLPPHTLGGCVGLNVSKDGTDVNAPMKHVRVFPMKSLDSSCSVFYCSLYKVNLIVSYFEKLWMQLDPNPQGVTWITSALVASAVLS